MDDALDFDDLAHACSLRAMKISPPDLSLADRVELHQVCRGAAVGRRAGDHDDTVAARTHTVLCQVAVGKIDHRVCRIEPIEGDGHHTPVCLLYTSPSPRDGLLSRMPSSA